LVDSLSTGDALRSDDPDCAAPPGPRDLLLGNS
jgi:hypothetical protein